MQKDLSLLIDATSSTTYLFLIKHDVVIDTFSKENNKDLSYSLIAYIEGILKNNNYSFDNLLNIYIIYGPGKFSAMRIGMVVAKTICILKGCNLFAIDKFDYICSSDCLCIVSSDGNKSFWCEYKNGNRINKPTLIENDLLEKIINDNQHNQIIFDKNIHQDVISKLRRFHRINEDFELEYYKEPC